MLFPKIPKNMTESNKGQNLDRWKRFISLIDTKKSINNLTVKTLFNNVAVNKFVLSYN